MFSSLLVLLAVIEFVASLKITSSVHSLSFVLSLMFLLSCRVPARGRFCLGWQGESHIFQIPPKLRVFDENKPNVLMKILSQETDIVAMYFVLTVD